ncbi:bifunctional methionine sulfoxide reductase B/A protein [Aliarcobacter cibarius]|jgi:peptide methionine sulfoxide reductase msrA/msrB|uniref:Peptide methionine sulfoxide reductase MsrA n=1 Tax=Aliarcobacter cibarius TaxID=255507 RepID=A0A5J6RJN4_9BACT|nr:bifunctional methionine sulfoxide reductase B/A protein [Aliarcobacter cibarius]QEZ89663.1 bifunctional (RS)-methionine sulfoxide reductase A/B [Aliarcobacter cibarius]QKJ27670.1 bifunctional (RS)-methionine sulfoxide reductase A/B [Aliarcobacter cibarius]TLT00707.1 bifunctional methionine sulfoxide reductase B/A protein [Aliarcobacter cibarius]TLT01001.1 bifunctional methionine sulfoxide reductase B/A protein [Aliarcobacter cibarius]TLT03855.1 bifunctional methionine sulfoxide reductase B/
MKYNILSEQEKYVIEQKGTERPFTGIYNDFYEEGTYFCKKCNAPLYKSVDKFKSGCGWPSFDDEIKGAVKRVPDADGRRVEIICASCGAHLGHVFEGEGFTSKNTRHCVNSISLNFEKNSNPNKKAYFAGGCFWGVEYYFQKQKGVKSVISGYMGGFVDNPTYEIVSTGNSGHLEVVEVTYDESVVSYESLAKLFFEIHDFTQIDGQGPDIGSQYLTAIFYVDESQRNIAQKLIIELEKKGYKVATTLHPEVTFYKAEDYHQNYYNKTGKFPYCHSYKKIF